MSKDQTIKVLFIGGREKGLLLLQELISIKAQIPHAYILKEDDHEIERYSDEVITLCQKNKIDYTLTKTVKNKVSEVLAYDPQLILVSGWRTIIPKEIVEYPKYGALALHEALLPKYRGFAPINWAVVNGEKEAGVTLFYLDEGVDSGDIVEQTKIPIGENDTAFEIYQKSIEASLKMVKKYYQAIVEGKAKRIKQDHSQATYTCTRTPDDGRIDWTKPSLVIHNLIRATSHPFPGAFCYYKTQKVVIQKSIIPKQVKWIGAIPGRIVGLKGEDGIEVLTGDGTILIQEIEIDGVKEGIPEYFKSIRERFE